MPRELPFDRYVVRLRLRRRLHLHFFHGTALRGILSRALDRHDLPPGLVPHAAESGRVHYEEGDEYWFGVTLIGPEARSLAPALALGLARQGARRTGRRFRGAPTVAGTFDFEALAFEPVPPPDLDAMRHRLTGAEALGLRFVSPLLLERPDELQVRRHRHCDKDCLPGPWLLDRLRRRCGRFDLPFAQTSPRTAAEGPIADPSGLFWADLPREDSPNAWRADPLGVVGRLPLTGLAGEDLDPILWGSFLHLGKSTLYGLGRFEIVELDGAEPLPFPAARTLLSRVADERRLAAAEEYLREKHGERSDSAGFVDPRPEPLPPSPLARQLAEGRWAPGPLHGALLPKPSGGVRALAIPAWRDRIAQRSTCEVLAPILDTLFEDCSFAYRKGFSRAGAAEAIVRAYEDGFRYVLDADIASFFDAVDWTRLRAKLDALFPHEPLVPLLARWIEAPVEFEGRRIERSRGLPQGSPIAPVLANLFLDELDDELLGEDFRLVRYADDFVVLSRDLAGAEAAKQSARAALERLGLHLHPEKTGIRSLDDGLTYLGYLFCRSLVLDSPNEIAAGAPATDLQIPPSSWLAQVPLGRVRELSRSGIAGLEGPPEPVQLAPGPGGLEDERLPLYITSPALRLSLREGSIVLEEDGRTLDRLPISRVSHVVLLGRTRATLPLLQALALHGMPTIVCRRSGELVATFGPHRPDWTTWQAQATWLADETRAVDFAREVVAAKLHNSATLAVRFDWAGGDTTAAELRDLARQCANPTTLDALRGLEGRGAALYFAALAATLDPVWSFAGREHRPPRDPVNALLSFGYTLLHSHLVAALELAGLNPRLGIYHQPRGAHSALASDLAEEFRHLVEATAWSMISRRRVKPEQFGPASDESTPCLLDATVRRLVIDELERRLVEPFTPAGEGDARPARLLFLRQAKRIRELVHGRSPRYRAVRRHA